ncbi:MAG TPA: EF-hand domain-containing protein [Reyranella sp.]|nr:EF-hand domain-containing protein [Reyranella sp.]
MRALVVAGLLLGVASAAQAQDRRFDRIDANHDGRISLQEYENYAGSRLMKAKGPHAQKFRSLDPEQQTAVLQHRFQRLDKEHKGFLVPADLQRHQG